MFLPRQIHRAADLPAVDLQQPDEGGDEVARLHGVVAVGPPGAAPELELHGAVVVSCLLQSQVPMFYHRLLDSTNKSYRGTHEPQPVVAIERDSTESKFVHVQVGTPLEDEGVRGGLQVDVTRQPPVVLRKDLYHFQEDEPRLHRGLAAVVHRLAPGLPVDLEAGDHRDRPVDI